MFSNKVVTFVLQIHPFRRFFDVGVNVFEHGSGVLVWVIGG